MNITNNNNIIYTLSQNQLNPTIGTNLIPCINLLNDGTSSFSFNVETGTADTYYNEVNLNFFQFSSDISQRLNNSNDISNITFTKSKFDLDVANLVTFTDNSADEVSLNAMNVNDFIDLTGVLNSLTSPELSVEPYILLNELGLITQDVNNVPLLMKDGTLTDYIKYVKIGTGYYILLIYKNRIEYLDSDDTFEYNADGVGNSLGFNGIVNSNYQLISSPQELFQMNTFNNLLNMYSYSITIDENALKFKKNYQVSV